MTALRGPILLVEDDADIREALLAFFEMNGLEVQAATNGKEALEAVSQPPRPSIILLDMAMPIMDGHRLLTARKQSEALREVPVLILSAGMAAMSPRDRARYASTYGVAAFVKKPADAAQVLELVRRHALRAPEAGEEAPPPAP